MIKEERALSCIRILEFMSDLDIPSDSDIYDSLHWILDEDGVGYQLEFTQKQLVEFMERAKNCAWDIPETLSRVCQCQEVVEFPMRRDFLNWPEDEETWEQIDRHFSKEHELDLTDPGINWNFCT